MKQFIKYLVIYCLPILIVGISAEIILRKIPNDYSYKKKYLDKNSKNIQVLFLGSSRIFYGINPEFIGPKYFNAAHIAQSLDFDYEILKKYENQLDSLKCVVIPADYSTLYGRLETGLESWRIKNYKIYYGIHPDQNFLSNTTEILSNKLNVNIGRLRKYLYKGETDLTCTPQGWGKAYNSKDNRDLISTGKKVATRHAELNDRYVDENIITYRLIIELAQKKNAIVVMVTCPTYKTYLQNMPPDKLNKAIGIFTDLADSYPNAVYVNLISDNSFDAIDFYDADHLNEIGAKKLTLKMDSLIASLPID